MYHWILLLTLAGLIQGQAIISRPKGVTEKTGGSAVFECKVDFTGSIHTMQWLYDDQIIYAYEKGKEDFPMGSKKYAIAQDGRTFNLTVKELDLTDGGKYTCIVVTDSASALLIVLDTPQLLTPKPDKVEGTTAQFTCKAKFSGPSEEDDFPELQMSIGGDPRAGTIHLKEPDALTDFYQYTKVFNITLESSMNGKELLCVIRTSDPALHASNTTDVRVLYPVRNINYSPVSEEYEVGAGLNCAADGNPEPEIVWDDIRNNENSITGNLLKVSKEMMGSNTWRCTASNTINGQPYHDNVVAVFETVSPADNAGASLGIGLGVAFAVCALVTTLILIYFCVWRKKKTKFSTSAVEKTGHEESQSQREKKSADGNGNNEGKNTDPENTETLMPLLYEDGEYHENTFKNDLVSERWLHTNLSGKEIPGLLKKNGDFLITYHKNQEQPYKLSYIWSGTITHIWIKFDTLKRVWSLEKVDKGKEFKNISDLVLSLPGREVTVDGHEVTFTKIIMREGQEEQETKFNHV